MLKNLYSHNPYQITMYSLPKEAFSCWGNQLVDVRHWKPTLLNVCYHRHCNHLVSTLVCPKFIYPNTWSSSSLLLKAVLMGYTLAAKTISLRLCISRLLANKYCFYSIIVLLFYLSKQESLVNLFLSAKNQIKVV